jgi:hypothetical protein
LRGLLKAKAKVTVPTRPTNIEIIKIIFPVGLIEEVIPVLNPTVQKALTSSKRRRANPNWASVILSAATLKKIKLMENKKTEKARRSNSKGTVVLNSSTLFSPRMVDNADKKTRAKVLVLMPPAVEPELPPMNMRKRKNSKVGSAMAPKSKVLNPAVRAVADWKKEVIPCSQKLNPRKVPGSSRAQKTKVPKINNALADPKAIRVLTDICFQGWRFLARICRYPKTSRNGENPMPPKINVNAMTRWSP